MPEKKPNRLIHESSPYLLQHAHNPVDWHPWGEAALEKAAREDKLMIVSIGYSSCHWCHVMEHESFEDNIVAQFMNEHYVCIKVDREERPDIDVETDIGKGCRDHLGATIVPVLAELADQYARAAALALFEAGDALSQRGKLIIILVHGAINSRD